MLEWVTELREMFYLLDYWFIVKGYKSGTAGWKRARGEGKGAGMTGGQAAIGFVWVSGLVYAYRDQVPV